MKGLYVALVVGGMLTLRLSIYRWRKKRRASALSDDATGTASATERAPSPERPSPADLATALLGDLGTVAGREIRERVRGRLFRIGTLVILVAVAAAIVIPTLHKSGNGLTAQRVGVVGALSPAARDALQIAAAANGDSVTLHPEGTLAGADGALRSGRLDLAVVDGDEIVLSVPASSKHSTADAGLVSTFAHYLGVLRAYHSAGLTTAQIAEVTGAKAVAVRSLSGGSGSSTRAGSVVGLVLLFLMLNQYDTWILMGVMQEKSSRVVEVLLATVRPLQLLAGKVIGIGLVALAQAGLIVGFALVLAKAVGSDLVHGTAPLALAAELTWLVLGYAFYCWVYAAAGSTAERQDQVQTIALPLSIPIVLGYIVSITAVSSGSASAFVKVLAYLPPTAPFCMSALVSLGDATWWEFAISVLATIAAIAAMAVFAAAIYRRAVLRTGGRVRLKDLRGHHAR